MTHHEKILYKMFIPLKDVPEIVLSDNLKDKVKYAPINNIGSKSEPTKKKKIDESFYEEVDYMDKIHDSIQEITKLMRTPNISDEELERLDELLLSYETARIVYEKYRIKMGESDYNKYATSIYNDLVPEPEEEYTEEYIEQRSLTSLIK